MIRIATKNDLAVLKELWYESFLEHDSKESIDYYFDNSLDLEHTLLLIVEDQLVCALCLNQHVLNIDGILKDVSFVVGVATFKAQQRKGHMRVLLEYALKYAKNTLKQDLMILQAYNWDVYRSFGFIETYYKSKVQYQSIDLVKYSTTTLVEFNEIKLLDIYNEYTKNLNGYKIRDIDYYLKQKDMLAVDSVEIALSDSAYVFYNVEDNVLKVSECAFINKEELFKLLNTLANKDKIESIEVFSDDTNFDNDVSELFMMSLVLNEEYILKADKLYISEWI